MDYQPIRIEVERSEDGTYQHQVFAGRSKKPIAVSAWTYTKPPGEIEESLTFTLPKGRFKILFKSPPHK